MVLGDLLFYAFGVKNIFFIRIAYKVQIVCQPQVGKIRRVRGEPFDLLSHNSCVSIPGDIFFLFKNFLRHLQLFDRGVGISIAKIGESQGDIPQTFIGSKLCGFFISLYGLGEIF